MTEAGVGPCLQQIAGGGARAAALLEGGDDVAGDGLHVDLVGTVSQAGGAGAAHHPLQGRISGVAEGAVTWMARSMMRQRALATWTLAMETSWRKGRPFSIL